MTCTYAIAHKANPAIRHYMSTGARAFPAQSTAYHESRRGPTRPSMLDIVYVAVASSIAKYITPSHVMPTSCPRLATSCPRLAHVLSTSGLPRKVPAAWHLGAAELALARPHRSDWADASIAWPERPSPTRRVPTFKPSMYMVLGRVLPSRQFSRGRLTAMPSQTSGDAGVAPCN